LIVATNCINTSRREQYCWHCYRRIETAVMINVNQPLYRRTRRGTRGGENEGHGVFIARVSAVFLCMPCSMRCAVGSPIPAERTECRCYPEWPESRFDGLSSPMLRDAHPLIRVEDSKLGCRLRESKLGPTRRNTLLNVASQQCRWRKLLDVAMRLAGVDQRLRAAGPLFCNVLTGIGADRPGGAYNVDTTSLSPAGPSW